MQSKGMFWEVSPQHKCLWCWMLLCLYLAICLWEGHLPWIPALSTPQTKHLNTVKNVLWGQKMSTSWKMDVFTQVDLYRYPLDELNAAIGISPRYLQSPQMARSSDLLGGELEQMAAALDHHRANTFLLKRSCTWKCHQSTMDSLWPLFVANSPLQISSKSSITSSIT